VALALLGFAIALLVFLMVPPFLTQEVGLAPGFTGQEAMDLVTPIATMALFVLAIELTGRPGTSLRVLMAAVIAVWVAGQGIHLAANGIGDVFESGAARDAFYATPVGALDHWLDEVLGHWLWHVGWLGLLAVLLWVGGTGRPDDSLARPVASGVAGLAGAIHGFTWFVVTDEGGTWQLAIPAMVVVLGLAWFVRRHDGSGRVVSIFLIVGAIVALVLYAAWVIVAGWEPKSIIDYFKLL
jgi:chromate transport protein ChrA